MSKQFCPQCGYKTLERVLVTVDADGNKVYRGRRKPASTKGLRVSCLFCCCSWFYRRVRIISFCCSFRCRNRVVANTPTIRYWARISRERRICPRRRLLSRTIHSIRTTYVSRRRSSPKMFSARRHSSAIARRHPPRLVSIGENETTFHKLKQNIYLHK